MEERKMTKEELLAKAEKPARDAMKMHPYYRGKIEMVPKCVIRDVNDFAIWYTPGVAEPCKEIQRNPDAVFEQTNKANMVGSRHATARGCSASATSARWPPCPSWKGRPCSSSTWAASMPFLICLDTKDPDEFIKTVKYLCPTFGGINLEDIENPKCFYILERLRNEAPIPVWHDDQQGTAAVTVAGLINALKIVRKEDGRREDHPDRRRRRQRLHRPDARQGRGGPEEDAGGRQQGHPVEEARRHRRKDPQGEMGACADRRTGREGTETWKRPSSVRTWSSPSPSRDRTSSRRTGSRRMADNAIVFVCANPIPEIWPWEAKEAGARIVATGRSDFPNQVNNSIGFPAIFRGTLDVMARTITDEMCIAAATELARCAEDKGLSEDHLLPTMDEWEVFPREAVAVAKKAMEQGVARLKLSEKELFAMAEGKIRRAQEEVGILMEKGIIQPYKE